MTTVIRADGLGKRYHRGLPADTGLRHVLEKFLRSPLSALRRGRTETFWALRDVSFEIKQGDVVGIIGRNGAGKTTLLKILSRITRPTTGWAEIRGKVGSLLEVGTGFHPELTGRENTFLSGAILGMSRREIARKFDEIVAFAEIDKFIDTPVKYYSSGMYVRLAFAVAAHLDPEILLVDEVLAVGDVQFQKKCLGKMREVGSYGRTVLFVSHNVNAVSSLCRSAMVFANGELVHFSDSVQEALRLYVRPVAGGHTVNLSCHPGRTSDRVVFEEISINEENKGASHGVLPGANVLIYLRVRPTARITSPKIGIGVTNIRGERVFAIGTYIGGTHIPSIEGPATICVRFKIPALVPGQYSLDIGLYDRTGIPLDEVYGAATIDVLKDDYITMVDSHTHEMGSIMVRSVWTCILDVSANSAN
jgi:lipopolysaccharide transport system ATP-binding protein